VPVHTFATNEVFTAANANTYIRDLGQRVIATCHANGTQSVARVTPTGVLLQTEDYDADGIHSTSTNTSRFTPIAAGYYIVTGFVAFAQSSAGVYREAQTYKNNVSLVGHHRRKGFFSSSLATVLQVASVPFFLNGTTDYVEVQAQHDSTAGLVILNAGVCVYRLRGS
jgi:hypothetical protein